jgi:tetratricopeptide (TPR) repeat protein
MQAQEIQNAQEPANREEKQKQKKDRFTWWQSLIVIVATLIICIAAGYFISTKYLLKNENDQLTKQLDYYKAQVDKKPNNANLRVQLGYSYFLTGDDDSAIKELNTAKSLDKNSYGAFLNLSIVYDKENQTDDALQNAIKAEKLSPNDYKPLLLEGRSYRKLKMYKKATEALQKANQFKPDNTDITYEAGLVALDQGKKKDAESIFKQVLSFDPTFKPALDQLDKLQSKNK